LPFELFFSISALCRCVSSYSAFWYFALTTEFATAAPAPAKAPIAVAIPISIGTNPPVFICS